jgi:hypothetical protein
MRLHREFRSYGGTGSRDSVSHTESEVAQGVRVSVDPQNSHITDLSANRPKTYQGLPQDSRPSRALRAMGEQ